jgi:hypothetical protein
MLGVGETGTMTTAVEEGGMVGGDGLMAGAVEDSGKGLYVKCGLERGVFALAGVIDLRLQYEGVLDAGSGAEGVGVTVN